MGGYVRRGVDHCISWVGIICFFSKFEVVGSLFVFEVGCIPGTSFFVIIPFKSVVFQDGTS